MRRIRFFIFILFLGLPIYIYLGQIPIPKNNSLTRLDKQEFRIAHRCAKSILPENTLLACKEVFHKSLADILEMDVHLTKDNHLVVIHDTTVDRTTNGKGNVSELEYAEILKLDAGYTFTEDGKSFPFRGKEVQILELEEFFKELPTAKYYIELKVKEPLAAKILVELIEKYRMQDKVYVGSVNDSVNENLKSLSNGKIPVFSGLVSTGKWYLAYLLGIRGIVKPPQIMAIPDLPRVMPITENFVRAVKEQNIKVHIFTINTREQIQRFKALGLDGVMTDNPYLFSKP
jgi:glycerophosphoryl diester phosphodiesterase